MTLQAWTNFVRNPKAATASDGDVVGWLGYGTGEPWIIPEVPIQAKDAGSPFFANVQTYGELVVPQAAPDLPTEWTGVYLADPLAGALPAGATYTAYALAASEMPTTATIALTWYPTIQKALDFGDWLVNYGSEAVPVTSTLGDTVLSVTSGPAPTSGGVVRVTIQFNGLGENLAGTKVWASAIAVVRNEAGNAPYSGGYFDGDFTDTDSAVYKWAGTPNNSPSTFLLRTTPPLTPPSSATATPVSDDRSFSPIQIINFSVVEDSTPIDPSDTTGGVGQFILTIPEQTDTQTLLDVPVNLSLVTQGETTGTVRGAGAVDGLATVTADSRLALLNAERQAQPFIGTLGQAFNYYLSLVDVTTGIFIEPEVGDIEVVLPGWNGNVWDQMKKMALAHGAEISLVSNNIVLRPVNERVAENYRDASVGWSLDTSQLARSVEVYYYDPTPITEELVYPIGGWNPEVPIFTVGAGETQTFDIPLSASLDSIEQPTALDFVDRYYDSTSVYAVTDKDGLPYLAAQWLAEGGNVEVAVNPDTRSLTVTITGASATEYAPYSIAVASGSSDRYSSLRLVGTGVRYDRQLVTLHTSVDPERVTVEVGATVDNEFIQTKAQAVQVGTWASKRWGSPRYTLNVSTAGINRLGDNGSYRYPTVDLFNSLWAGQDVDDFNVEWTGETIAAFNEYMISLVQNDFANQAFGNIAGARVPFRDAWFRIRSATNAAEGIGYTAEEATTVADFNERWAGATVADFNTEWLSARMTDFAIRPLRGGT